ncbi:MAG: hypothetical protein L0Z50_13310 [Verrucomicrobiales bacterium]|nr:hypothetical protein [Verrucomicrobiales bacterium]
MQPQFRENILNWAGFYFPTLFKRLFPVVLLSLASFAATAQSPDPDGTSSVGDVFANLPAVSIRAVDPETSEPSPNTRVRPGRLILTRAGSPSDPLMVFVSFDGTALYGVDYEKVSQFVQFDAGKAEAELLIGALEDLLPEDTESVIVRVEESPFDRLPDYRPDPNQREAKVVIHDSSPPLDRPMVSIVATAFETWEDWCCPACDCAGPSPRPALFAISRRGPGLDQALTVVVGLSGDAKPGADYTIFSEGGQLSGTAAFVTFPAGKSSIDLGIHALWDDETEPDEVVVGALELLPVGAPIDPYIIDPEHSAARVVIHDKSTWRKPAIEITAPPSGSAFRDPERIVFQAVTYDPNGAITHLDWFAGDQKIGESDVVFIQPPQPGLPVTHEFPWSNPPAGVHQVTALGVHSDGLRTVSLPVTIYVFRGQPVVPIVSVRATQPETIEPCPTCRPAPAVFTIVRTEPVAEELLVFVKTGGTATEGSDYESIGLTAVIPAGKESVDLQVIPKADDLVERDETVVLELLDDHSLRPVPAYYVNPGHREAKAVIHDVTNPTQPIITVEAIDPDASEVGPDGQPDVAVFRFSRTGPVDFDQPVGFGFYCPTCLFAKPPAENGVDFEKVPTTIVIPKGSTYADLVIKPIPDKALEGDEPLPVWIEDRPCILIFPPPRDCYVPGDRRLAIGRIHDQGTGRDARVTIVKPANGTVFVEPEEIVFVADTLDPKGAITHLDWFAGEEKIGDTTIFFIRQPDPGTPITHEFHWKNPRPGEHSVRAVGQDANGARVVSTPVLVQVVRNFPPDVAVVTIEATSHTAECPLNTACDIAPGRFSLMRKASRLDQPLTVHLKYGGTATPGSDYKELPPTVTFDAGKELAELFVYAATDHLSEGTETVEAALVPPPMAQLPYAIGWPGSAVVKIEERISWRDAATLEITEPKQGQHFPAGEVIRISATAIDPKADIRRVEFYDGRDLIGVSEHFTRDAVIPGRPRVHIFEWSGAKMGQHELRAVALDSEKHTVVSPSVHILVNGEKGVLRSSIARIHRMADRKIQLVLEGDPAKIHYDVEVSTDLTKWEKIGEFMPGDFSFFYEDESAKEIPTRFYRAVERGKP